MSKMMSMLGFRSTPKSKQRQGSESLTPHDRTERHGRPEQSKTATEIPGSPLGDELPRVAEERSKGLQVEDEELEEESDSHSEADQEHGEQDDEQLQSDINQSPGEDEAVHILNQSLLGLKKEPSSKGETLSKRKPSRPNTTSHTLPKPSLLLSSGKEIATQSTRAGLLDMPISPTQAEKRNIKAEQKKLNDSLKETQREIGKISKTKRAIPEQLGAEREASSVSTKSTRQQNAKRTRESDEGAENRAAEPPTKKTRSWKAINPPARLHSQDVDLANDGMDPPVGKRRPSRAVKATSTIPAKSTRVTRSTRATNSEILVPGDYSKDPERLSADDVSKAVSKSMSKKAVNPEKIGSLRRNRARKTGNATRPTTGQGDLVGEEGTEEEVDDGDGYVDNVEDVEDERSEGDKDEAEDDDEQSIHHAEDDFLFGRNPRNLVNGITKAIDTIRSVSKSRTSRTGLFREVKKVNEIIDRLNSPDSAHVDENVEKLDESVQAIRTLSKEFPTLWLKSTDSESKEQFERRRKVVEHTYLYLIPKLADVIVKLWSHYDSDELITFDALNRLNTLMFCIKVIEPNLRTSDYAISGLKELGTFAISEDDTGESKKTGARKQNLQRFIHNRIIVSMAKLKDPIRKELESRADAGNVEKNGQTNRQRIANMQLNKEKKDRLLREDKRRRLDSINRQIEARRRDRDNPQLRWAAARQSNSIEHADKSVRWSEIGRSIVGAQARLSQFRRPPTSDDDDFVDIDSIINQRPVEVLSDRAATPSKGANRSGEDMEWPEAELNALMKGLKAYTGMLLLLFLTRSQRLIIQGGDRWPLLQHRYCQKGQILQHRSPLELLTQARYMKEELRNMNPAWVEPWLESV
jgi:hypothetical protein